MLATVVFMVTTGVLIVLSVIFQVNLRFQSAFMFMLDFREYFAAVECATSQSRAVEMRNRTVVKVHQRAVVAGVRAKSKRIHYKHF